MEIFGKNHIVWFEIALCVIIFSEIRKFESHKMSFFRFVLIYNQLHKNFTEKQQLHKNFTEKQLVKFEISYTDFYSIISLCREIMHFWFLLVSCMGHLNEPSRAQTYYRLYHNYRSYKGFLQYELASLHLMETGIVFMLFIASNFICRMRIPLSHLEFNKITGLFDAWNDAVD